MVRIAAAVLSSLVALVSWAQAAPLAPRVTVAEYADLVVVTVHDLDLLRAAYPALAAEVRLAGIETVYRADLAAEYQTPAILIRKARPVACGRVSVTLRDGDRELLRQEIPTTPAPAAEPRVPLTDAQAFIERGAGLTGEAPTIRQPDLAQLPVLPLADAERTVDMNAIVVRVVSDTNFPLVSANNNCAVSRQTAHPDDPGRRSCYVPLKSQLYDPQTGNPARVVHYIAEVPLRPEWLQGTGDTVIPLGPAEIKVHTSDKRWPPADPKGQLITGEGAGGLGQGVGCLAVDEAGNLYYSHGMAQHVARFNVAKGEWESPPINIMDVMNEHLPKKAELPETLRVKTPRWDDYGYVAVGGGRLFFSPVRYAVYGESLYCNGVFSFPLEHWYDAAKFRAGGRLVARCCPGSPLSLYDLWPTAGGTAPKVAPGVYHEGQYYLTSYAGTGGGPWCVALHPDGSGKSISRIKEPDFHNAWIAATPKLRTQAGGFINWWDYGVLATSRGALSQLLTGTRDERAKGEVTLHYDAVAAMRLAPQRYAEIISNLKGPSLAPCYMAAAIPDKPGHMLGVGEYGYHLADLDLTDVAHGVARKQYLPLDTGEARGQLPVKVGLGPYGHLWWREGDRRYLVMMGYTGIVRMLYSVGGKPLDRFQSVPITIARRGLDGPAHSGFKWVKYPVAGIGGRIYYTGSGEVDRGGQPYDNGLSVFSFADPKESLCLTRMTRACHTGRLRSRVLFDPDGRRRQEFFLIGGTSVPAYVERLAPQDQPANRDAKEFLYECAEGDEPRALLGFSQPVVADNSGVACHVLSRDRRFLVTFQHGCLLTFDLGAQRYADGRRIEGDAWRFCKPDFHFNVAPDDRIFFCVQGQDAAKATFYEVDISPAGAIALKPHLTMTGPDAAAVQSVNGAVIAFVPDPSGDGSYDLCLGPYWRAPGTQVRLIRDFIPARKSQ